MMMEANKEVVLNLKAIIIWFKAISGLYVNYVNSSVYMVNDVLNGEELVELWG